MNKIIFTIIAVLIICGSSFGQNPQWAWAKSAGGNSWDYANSIVTDNIGNVYAVGFFDSPSIAFGSTTLINDTTGNQPNLFIVKYDGNGNVLWAKSSNGGIASAKSIAIDNSNNLYVTGVFYSQTINFGNITLTNSDSLIEMSNIFIVKYDPNGNVLLAIRADSANGFGYAYANCITTDLFGNIFIVGYFQFSSITFGFTTLQNDTINTTDIFIVKYDSSLNFKWAKREGGTKSDEANSVVSDASGNIYVCGEFQSTVINFDSTIFNNSDSTGIDYNIFILKLDSGGNQIWVKKTGGVSSDIANSINHDNLGNIYVTGNFNGQSITFDTITLNSINGDMFIAKYDSSGNLKYVKKPQSNGVSYGHSIAIDISNNVYIVGEYGSIYIAFDMDTLFSINSGGINIFVVKYDTSGNVQFVKNAGGNNVGQAYSIAIDNIGNKYVAGSFAGDSMIFGSTILINDTFNYSADMFLAKIDFNSDVPPISLSPSSTLLFPNPISQSSTLQINSSLPGKVKVSIYNILGQNIITQESDSHTIYLNSNDFSEGIYFYRAMIGDTFIGNGKFVVE
jgi:arginine repressor